MAGWCVKFTFLRTSTSNRISSSSSYECEGERHVRVCSTCGCMGVVGYTEKGTGSDQKCWGLANMQSYNSHVPPTAPPLLSSHLPHPCSPPTAPPMLSSHCPTPTLLPLCPTPALLPLAPPPFFSPHLSDFHNLDSSQLAGFNVPSLWETSGQVISLASSRHTAPIGSRHTAPTGSRYTIGS